MRAGVPSTLRIDGDHGLLAGDLTLDFTARLLTQGRRAIQTGMQHLDLSGVAHMDSSALSLLLGLRRHAQKHQRSLALHAVPASLQSLAKLYGVSELLN